MRGSSSPLISKNSFVVRDHDPAARTALTPGARHPAELSTAGVRRSWPSTEVGGPAARAKVDLAAELPATARTPQALGLKISSGVLRFGRPHCRSDQLELRRR